MKSIMRMSMSMSKRISIFFMFLAMVLSMPVQMRAAGTEKEEGNDLDVKEIIFEHLGDGYGWEVPFNHVRRIPLPVIVRAEDGNWFCFSSAGLTEIHESAGKDGKTEKHLVPVLKTIDRDGKAYNFMLMREGKHKDKVVELIPLVPGEKERIDKEDTLVTEDGDIYRTYRPLDLSITKNVLAIFISALLVLAMVMGLVKYYGRRGLRAPRKGMGFFEMLVSFVYYDTIKSTLGENARRFGPYLLTCFFFILTMNLVGLIVIFPGGANLTGNIAVTLVLAVMTFLVTNILGTKHYWKEIFWPNAPIYLKLPLPIMPFVEFFGVFTKPFALMIRLFANIMAGHTIILALTCLIFITVSMGLLVNFGMTIVSVLFCAFMNCLELLVACLQAYIFTLLSANYIGLAKVKD